MAVIIMCIFPNGFLFTSRRCIPCDVTFQPVISERRCAALYHRHSQSGCQRHSTVRASLRGQLGNTVRVVHFSNVHAPTCSKLSHATVSVYLMSTHTRRQPGTHSHAPRTHAHAHMHTPNIYRGPLIFLKDKPIIL